MAGTIRPVRRSFYDPASAPGQGWQWEWENDAGTWTPYDIEVAIAIENAHYRQQPCLDLTPLGFCYLIDFQKMTQVCVTMVANVFRVGLGRLRRSSRRSVLVIII